MTREQILAEAGISPELTAERERLAALSDVELKAMLAQRRQEFMQQEQIGTSTKLSCRWLSKATPSPP